MDGADPGNVSERALKRGSSGLGTLGSGNHFVEVSFVEQIFNKQAARGLRTLSGSGCFLGPFRISGPWPPGMH